MNQKFVNAYGEEMSPNAMLHQVLHRVAELEKVTKDQTYCIKQLRETLETHNHEDSE